jgi:hypothetical protein
MNCTALVRAEDVQRRCDMGYERRESILVADSSDQNGAIIIINQQSTIRHSSSTEM